MSVPHTRKPPHLTVYVEPPRALSVSCVVCTRRIPHGGAWIVTEIVAHGGVAPRAKTRHHYVCSAGCADVQERRIQQKRAEREQQRWQQRKKVG